MDGCPRDLRESSFKSIVQPYHPIVSTALAQLQVILRRDATDTTYMFAVLRALIDIADEFDHLVDYNENDWVTVPLGLVIERWLLYYFPLVEAQLPQRNGADPANPTALNITFWADLARLVDRYRGHGGFTAFASDLKRGRLRADDADIEPLLKKLRATIIGKPMRYLGMSVFDREYQLTLPNRNAPRLGARRFRAPLDVGFLVANFGTFRVRREFYDIFRELGGFVSGTDAVLYQWAQFTSRAVRTRPVRVQDALGPLLASPDTSRAVNDARQAHLAHLAEGGLRCVWSDRRITTPSVLAVDHVIPFSLWGNNDLWNLLPAHAAANASKRDRIPAPDLVQRRRSAITDTWVSLRERYPDAFDRELQASLIGFQLDPAVENWAAAGVDAVAGKCEYLIIERGFEAWTP